MNIVDAMYYQTLSPENLSGLIVDSIQGFEDAKIRKINFYDVFLIIPFYMYSPVNDVFSRIIFNPNTSFQNKIERNPDLCANFPYRYKELIEYSKKALIYMIDKEIIEMDKDLNLILKENKKVQDKIVFNVAKVFSIRETAKLYSFLKVDIDVI